MLIYAHLALDRSNGLFKKRPIDWLNCTVYMGGFMHYPHLSVDNHYYFLYLMWFLILTGFEHWVQVLNASDSKNLDTSPGNSGCLAGNLQDFRGISLAFYMTPSTTHSTRKDSISVLQQLACIWSVYKPIRMVIFLFLRG